MYCKHTDRIKDECGVFGIFGTDEASVLTTLTDYTHCNIEVKKELE